jgi:hypothetical protein
MNEEKTREGEKREEEKREGANLAVCYKLRT